MKLSVIGGGGVRSMFLAKSLVQRAAELHINHIIFMDNNQEKLKIYGGMARQVAKRIDPSIQFTLTADPIEAVRDVDYVITTIRVGEDDKRIDDERIALNHGVLGQETTGAAGLSFAMRSIPALVEYCELIRQYAAPHVKMFNFTNPAGVVSQTLSDLGYDFTYGICDAPSSLLHDFAKIYGVAQDRITGECFGLNHLSFFKHIYLDGQDIMHDLMDNDRVYTESEMRFFDKAFVKQMGHMLNEYLYYFFSREQAVDNILKAGETRGEVIRDINIHMTAALSQMDVEHDFDNCLQVYEHWYGQREAAYMANETGVKNDKPPFKFDIYAKDAGGYAGVALKYIQAEQTHQPVEMILCVPNQGAIAALADGDIVEISCTITDQGCMPHKQAHIDEIPLEIIRRVKVYERLASKAIREKSIQAAEECLLMHPLVNSYTLAHQIVAEYLISNQEYTEGWH